jgi:hypothetical protein
VQTFGFIKMSSFHWRIQINWLKGWSN